MISWADGVLDKDRFKCSEVCPCCLDDIYQSLPKAAHLHGQIPFGNVNNGIVQSLGGPIRLLNNQCKPVNLQALDRING